MAEDKNKAEYTCTRVTPSMVVNGSIDSTDNILVEGPVYGNIKTNSNVTIKSTVVGDLSAENAALDGAKIKGNIKLSGTAAANGSSVVVGGIDAQALKLEGKVRGNVEVKESALLSETALLVGDITAQYVTAQTGARILGKIQTAGPSLSVDVDKEFDIPDFMTNEENGGTF